MLGVLLKHIVYEKAINTLFERISLNFTKVFPMPHKGDIIEIKFKKKGNRDIVYSNHAQVHTVMPDYMLIIYAIHNDSKFDRTLTVTMVYKEDIYINGLKKKTISYNGNEKNPHSLEIHSTMDPSVNSMFKTLLIHIILEQAIENAFNNAQNNFTQIPFALPIQGDFINITFKDSTNNCSLTKVNAYVENVSNKYISVVYYRGVTCTTKPIPVEYIVEWNNADNASYLIQNK